MITLNAIHGNWIVYFEERLCVVGSIRLKETGHGSPAFRTMKLIAGRVNSHAAPDGAHKRADKTTPLINWNPAGPPFGREAEAQKSNGRQPYSERWGGVEREEKRLLVETEANREITLCFLSCQCFLLSVFPYFEERLRRK